jgi:HD-like signal output (HDOD) protein
MRKRILFVDDEPNVLQGLHRMLHPMRQAWDMAFAESAEAALALLAQAPFDVVVSDMRMPKMDGAQLLAEIRQRYPRVVRIILSGHSDQGMVLRSVGAAHQYLAKPCDAEMVKATVARACALQNLVADAALQQLVTGMEKLPSLPMLYLEVTKIIASPHGSLEQVGEVVARDIGMAAKLLQLVNSAFFGLRRQVSSPVEAVKLLGLDTVKALVLSVQVFAQFEPSLLLPLSLHALWEHSLATGSCAKSIARLEKSDRQAIDEAYMVGLLHDVGQLILAANLPEQYAKALVLAQEHHIPDWEAERAIFGASHGEVGAYLLGLWGLPETVTEALAFHHCPSAHPQPIFSPLTVVHVANGLVQEETIADPSILIDLEYLTALGCRERLTGWREHYRTSCTAAARA